MIFTIGRFDLFEAAIDQDIAIKLGPHRRPDGTDDPGGWVWHSAKNARDYLVLRNSLATRRVYGVMADWDADTRTVPGQPTRCLNRDARVVRFHSPIEGRASSARRKRSQPESDRAAAARQGPHRHRARREPGGLTDTTAGAPLPRGVPASALGKRQLHGTTDAVIRELESLQEHPTDQRTVPLPASGQSDPAEPAVNNVGN
jgi:hypothetical protein